MSQTIKCKLFELYSENYFKVFGVFFQCSVVNRWEYCIYILYSLKLNEKLSCLPWKTITTKSYQVLCEPIGFLWDIDGFFKEIKGFWILKVSFTFKQLDLDNWNVKKNLQVRFGEEINLK